MSGLLVLSFPGADSRAAAQSISLPGAKVGDVVVFVSFAATGFAPQYFGTNIFEGAISVDDEIQQGASGNSGNLSGETVTALLVRP